MNRTRVLLTVLTAAYALPPVLLGGSFLFTLAHRTYVAALIYFLFFVAYAVITPKRLRRVTELRRRLKSERSN